MNTFGKIKLYKIFFSIVLLCSLTSIAYAENGVQKDSDLDGLSDQTEVSTYHTDINSPDTDKDGVVDYQEILDKTNPLDNKSSTLANLQMQDVPTIWYVGRIAGISAFIMFTLVICFGLLMTSKVLLKFKALSAPTALDTHQFTATFIAFGLTLLHIVAFMLDDIVKLTFLEVLIPFYVKRDLTTYMGANLGLTISIGIIAFYLPIILIATSQLRRKIVSVKLWRKIHYVSFLFYLMFLGHGIFAGSDTDKVWMQVIYGLSVTMVTSLVLLRIFGKKYFLPKPFVQQSSNLNESTTNSQNIEPLATVQPL